MIKFPTTLSKLDRDSAGGLPGRLIPRAGCVQLAFISVQGSFVPLGGGEPTTTQTITNCHGGLEMANGRMRASECGRTHKEN